MPRFYKRRPFIRTRAQKLLLFSILVTLFLFPVNAFYDRVTPLLADAAFPLANAYISESVSRYAAGYDLGELVVLEANESGVISNIRTDTERINEIKASFISELTKELKKSTVKIGVPIGDIIALPATLGNGPSLPIRITVYSSTVTDIKSEFTTAGINQTLHRITMSVAVEYTLVFPNMKTKKTTVTTEIPLAETVIIGQVPSYYRK